MNKIPQYLYYLKRTIRSVVRSSAFRSSFRHTARPSSFVNAAEKTHPIRRTAPPICISPRAATERDPRAAPSLSPPFALSFRRPSSPSPLGCPVHPYFSPPAQHAALLQIQIAIRRRQSISPPHRPAHPSSASPPPTRPPVQVVVLVSLWCFLE